MATAETDKIPDRRHPEWVRWHRHWRWLLDSFEGGNRYRQATYGVDHRGYPIRNLIRHKREYPDPKDVARQYGSYPQASRSLLNYGDADGSDPFAAATDDDYELRRARTPVPTFMQEAVEGHLAHIYDREITRHGGPDLEAWWKDVDGFGASIDRFMQEDVAPYLMTLGCLDLLFENPAAPVGEPIGTQADVRRLGLDRCVASVILPQDMVWWRLDPRSRRYAECLVRECGDESDAARDGRAPVNYRHWTGSGWTLYDDDGEEVGRGTHHFGVVPIVRLFDRRAKDHHNLPIARYEPVADYMREYYNRESELILSDTIQAHPLLQGPEDWVQADGTVPVGPSWLLPKKKHVSGSSVSYEPFNYLDPPKGAAESIRANQDRNEGAIRRYTHQMRDVGDATYKGTLEQSGISKAIDHQAAHKQLKQVAASLQRAEYAIAEFALLVLTGGNRAFAGDRARQPATEVVYPQDFDLYNVSDVSTAISNFLELAAKTGIGCPKSEAFMMKRLLRLVLPGESDAIYKTLDAEADSFIASGGGLAKLQELQAAMQATLAQQKLSPAGDVRNSVQGAPALNPPGKGGGNMSGS